LQANAQHARDGLDKAVNIVHIGSDREAVSKDALRSPATTTYGGGVINGSVKLLARFFMPGGSMSDERPEYGTQIERLRGNRKHGDERRDGLIANWRTIEKMIAQGSPTGGETFGAPGSTVPSATLMSLSLDIDRFAHFHARCLSDEGAWVPRGIDTPNLLDGLATRIGHFINSDDARLAWDFHDELEQLEDMSHKAVNPDGIVWAEVGHRCTMTECNGRYKVQINRDNGHTAGWRPIAVCFTVDQDGREHMNREHAVDGLLLAATADLVAA